MLIGNTNEFKMLISIHKEMQPNNVKRYTGEVMNTIRPGNLLFYNKKVDPRSYHDKKIYEGCTEVMLNYILRSVGSEKKRNEKNRKEKLQETVESWGLVGVITHVEDFTETSKRVYNVSYTVGGFSRVLLPDPTILHYGNNVKLGLFEFSYLKNQINSSPYKDTHIVSKTSFYKDDMDIPQYVFYTHTKQLEGLKIFVLNNFQTVDIDIGTHVVSNSYGMDQKEVKLTKRDAEKMQNIAKSYPYNPQAIGYQIFCKLD